MLSRVIAQFQATGSTTSLCFSEEVHISLAASQGQPQCRDHAWECPCAALQHWFGGKWGPATGFREKEKPPYP